MREMVDPSTIRPALKYKALPIQRHIPRWKDNFMPNSDQRWSIFAANFLQLDSLTNRAQTGFAEPEKNKSTTKNLRAHEPDQLDDSVI